MCVRVKCDLCRRDVSNVCMLHAYYVSIMVGLRVGVCACGHACVRAYVRNHVGRGVM